MIHIMVGYMGFGKTTIAKELSKKHNAVVLNHDDVMHQLLGANPPQDIFMEFKPKVTELIWDMANNIVATNKDVIIDMGAWSVQDRLDIVKRAESIGVKVIFHAVDCPIEIAKERLLKRTAENKNALFIDENCFDMLLAKYEPISDDEGLMVERHKGY